MKRVLIVGAGQVGATLGQAWLKRGYDVRFGVPDPANPKYAELPRDRLQPAAERRGAEVIVLAVPFPAVQSAIVALGDIAGAIVIDCTNPLGMGPNGLYLTIGHDTSGGEQVAMWAKGALVFKTLNQTGAENMADTSAFGPKPMMFVAGDDADGKAVVLRMVADLGFDEIDAGSLVASRLLEPLAMLWIALATKLGHPRGFAFAKVRRAEAPDVQVI